MSLVVAAKQAVYAITSVMVKVKRRLNCVMIHVVQFGMIGQNGHHVLLHVVVVSNIELKQTFAPMYPTTSKCELVLPCCLMILITCGKSGNHVHLLALVVVESVKQNMSVELVVVLTQNHVVSKVFGWIGVNGQRAQLLVVLVR